MHVFQDFEFDFEEFDGCAHDSDFGVGSKGGSDETHGFDGVFRDIIFNVLIEERTTLNDEAGSTDAGNLNAELFEVETNVLNHVVRRGADDGGLARGEGGGHENVFSDGVATLSKDNITVVVFMKSFLSDFDFVEATMTFGVNGEAERFESLKVWFDGASTE